MNLVQLSEQLKDVPDNFLMTEVQNPSGSYPAYLIVSEMTRRKRMRENAPKQEPQTTVAEDLMGGGIRTMQPPMPQQMPGAAQTMASQMPMPQQMPQQAPQQPQMMAGGGLVAFERGGPIRAQDGLFVDPTMSDTFELSMPTPTQYTPTKKELERMTLTELQEYYRRGVAPDRRIPPPPVSDVYPDETQRSRVTDMRVPTTASAGARPTGAGPAGPAGAGPAGVATGMGAGQQAMRIAQDLASAKAPTYNREAGIAALREALPDTASQAMADYIRKQEGQMEGQRQSNLNMALMQAGLGMMGSRARSGIQGIAEGGLEGLKSYRAGLAEMQKGEQQIELARMKMAEAKDARERGLYDLSLKEEATAMDMFKQGQDAKYRAGSILAAVESAQRPTGRTVDTTPSQAEIKTAEENARNNLTTQMLATGQKLDINSPQYVQALQLEMQRLLAASGKIYNPMPMGNIPQNKASFAQVMGQ